jgi:hypothetical protein
MKSQIKVLVLLVITFVTLFLYATSSTGVTFAKQLLKKIDIDFSSKADTVQVAVVEEKMEPDSTSQRFLFVGDSMVEPLAYRFNDYCKESGDTMYAVTWYGSTTMAWSGETMDYYMDKVNPTYIIYCMGSNELSSKNVKVINENLERMKAKANGVPCIFIGPPNIKPDGGINEEIAKVFGKNRYFDSRNLEIERRNDHLHPTNSGARVWMDEICEWMGSEDCVHPVLLNKPQEGTSYKIEHIEVMKVKDKGRRLGKPSA